jgi:hypothetical protein
MGKTRYIAACPGFKRLNSTGVVTPCILYAIRHIPTNYTVYEGSTPSPLNRDSLMEEQQSGSMGSNPIPVNTRIAQLVRALHF